MKICIFGIHTWILDKKHHNDPQEVKCKYCEEKSLAWGDFTRRSGLKILLCIIGRHNYKTISEYKETINHARGTAFISHTKYRCNNCKTYLY